MSLAVFLAGCNKLTFKLMPRAHVGVQRDINKSGIDIFFQLLFSQML